MGNYTQFHAQIPLRKDTPDDVVLLLMHLIYDPECCYTYIDIRNDVLSEYPITLPDHPFFKTERWEGVFMGPNFEHDHGAKFTRSKSGYYDLEIHTDINYGYFEVTEFIKWITPYVAGRKKKQYIGWWKNENMNWLQNEYIER